MDRSGELERYRAGQLQAERLLEAREQSHRQQVLRLENQVSYYLVFTFGTKTFPMLGFFYRCYLVLIFLS